MNDIILLKYYNMHFRKRDNKNKIKYTFWISNLTYWRKEKLWCLILILLFFFANPRKQILELMNYQTMTKWGIHLIIHFMEIERHGCNFTEFLEFFLRKSWKHQSLGKFRISFIIIKFVVNMYLFFTFNQILIVFFVCF